MKCATGHHFETRSRLLTDTKDAYNTFLSTEVVLLGGAEKRQDADPDRNSTIPDAIYTLQCTDDVSFFVFGQMYIILTNM